MLNNIVNRLNCVFQTPLLPALDLVDRQNVTLLKSPSGRSVYQVHLYMNFNMSTTQMTHINREYM